ncbi:DUF6817 domain-containing protein [Streptomyces griseorubiginosus]|uniref:DUF6817 domain-containing protein n=1 Tax=Streptomyces griseorubiginosus TaxID=67304 RepID=UPI000B1C5AC3
MRAITACELTVRTVPAIETASGSPVACVDGGTDGATRTSRTPHASHFEHPGGTLLAHLERVEALLASWGGRPALRAAGLCHAFYGTDGFPLQLLNLEHRADLAEAIGADAEALAYLYASCDRKATYRTFAEDDGMLLDRFTGARVQPNLGQRRDLAELTAANELDLAAISPKIRTEYGASLLGLFTRWRPLLSASAWAHCRDVLG